MITTLKTLTNIANILDKKGLHKEADTITDVMVRVAQNTQLQSWFSPKAFRDPNTVGAVEQISTPYPGGTFYNNSSSLPEFPIPYPKIPAGVTGQQMYSIWTQWLQRPDVQQFMNGRQDVQQALQKYLAQQNMQFPTAQ